MKKVFLISVLCMIFATAFAQNSRIDLNPQAPKSLVNVDNFTEFSTTFSFQTLYSEDITTSEGTFSNIFIDGESVMSGNIGDPNLPIINRIIAIPEGSTPVVSIKGYSESEYTLADYNIKTISPRQLSPRKDANFDTIQYRINREAYSKNTFSEHDIATVEVLGHIRGLRIARLSISPVTYNAVAEKIIVKNDIQVSVKFENANYSLTQQMIESTYSPAFNSIYSQITNKSVYDIHPDPWHSPLRMLVICGSTFKDDENLSAWLQWKTQKGIAVDIFYTTETGTTSSSIKSFIQNKYNESVESGNAYSFLVTIGDHAQVPAATTYSNYNTYGASTTPSDLNYSSPDGDKFPDMLYSRISVENTTQLANYLNKLIPYEKFNMADGGDYLNNVILVGGWDSYWTSAIANPTINYATNYYFNSDNTTFGGFEGGTIAATISTSSTGGYSGSALGTGTAMGNGCFANINTTGAGLVNYTAHGDVQEWYQPKMTAKQVSYLQNPGKYFLGIGNCCLSGNFCNTSTSYSPGEVIGTNACFAESMIRVPNAGAIAYFGCAPYSYWYEDFYWGVGAHSFSEGNYPTTSESSMGFYDAAFVDEFWNTASSLLYVGQLAVAQAEANGNVNSVDCEYYFQFYHCFGDGSVMPYITKPEVNTVSHQNMIINGASYFTVNAVAGSYVAITDNNSVIYGVAIADASGVANVPIENLPPEGTAYIVVTRPQYQPYFGTAEIQIPTTPFITLEGYSPLNVAYETTNDLSITIKNVGAEATEGITSLTVSTDDEYITLNNATTSFAEIDAQGGTATSDEINFSVAANTPDGHVANLTATITYETYSWEYNLAITVIGPQCDAPIDYEISV
ncbi:MAG: hypothetical protein HUK15_09580, partial [Bacteroidales bacterium]|nr:hypothetical protein [Bacteroidales bacterium]